ncbi:MAG: tRNA lysidine(34) synthetase TilS, partial [Methylophilaceae bacterium]|nr:tRNA lysidine(34) synthetase TilS [Methylophilaceae bacterium]
MENSKQAANPNPTLPINSAKHKLPKPISSATGLTEKLDTTLRSLRGQYVLLAFSGGLDSTVLLHLLATTRQHYGFQVHALHVHHGLHIAADDWAKHCAKICLEWSVPLQVVAVEVIDKSGLGLEAAARQARYAALYRAAKALSVDWILTAHHQRDQAETLLLQLMRGAGVKGLAAMASCDSKRSLLRPLLDTPQSQLLNYARAHQLVWCDDASNENTYYSRNWVRHTLLPVLLAANSSVLANMARSATHCSEASDLLDNLAELDAHLLMTDQQQLKLARLQELSFARAKNVLRWWCGQNGLLMPSAAVLEEIYQQLMKAKSSTRL